MKRIIHNTPIHSFLLVPALIFFLFVYNYALTSVHSTLRSYLVATGISLFIFSCFYFLFKKNKHKAGVVTSSLMLILSFYGFIYETAEKMYYKGWWPFSEIHRYILSLILIFILILFYFLFRTKRSFHSLTLSFNVFVLTFIFINLGQLTSAIIKKNDKEIPVKIKTTPVKINNSYPDIYYIILDGYANDSILDKIYNYPDNSLTNFLQSTGFYVAKHSRANYISTDPSLSSSLNFSYLNTSNDTIGKIKNIIYDNKVSAYLKEKGYKVVHVRSGYSVSRENYNADTIITLNNLDEFERTLLKYTIFRLDDLLGYAGYKTFKEQLSVIYKALNVQGPKYVFIHIVSPHPPYMCDEYGNYKASPRITNVWWEPKKDYLAQLKYINTEVIKFTSSILRHSKTSPIIVIQSDHGPWIQSRFLNQIYHTRSMILNAYHIPFEWENKLYPTITPVNTFRNIFNGLFQDSLPILKDIPLDSACVINSVNSNLITPDSE